METVPTPKARPKFRRIGKFVSTYTPKKTKDYESLIAKHATDVMNGHEPLETPVMLWICFTMPIPVSHSKKRKDACLKGSEAHLKKPDIDNMSKSVLDAMNGIVYKDDGQIVLLHVTKRYGSFPNVDIQIMEKLL